MTQSLYTGAENYSGKKVYRNSGLGKKEGYIRYRISVLDCTVLSGKGGIRYRTSVCWLQFHWVAVETCYRLDSSPFKKICSQLKIINPVTIYLTDFVWTFPLQMGSLPSLLNHIRQLLWWNCTVIGVWVRKRSSGSNDSINWRFLRNCYLLGVWSGRSFGFRFCASPTIAMQFYK